MFPEIVHLWGPFSIRGYGLMILMGLALFSWLLLHDARRPRLITQEQYFQALFYAIIAALVGGRVLSILTRLPESLNWHEIIIPWEGGFSVLGSTLAVLIIIPWYLSAHCLAVVSLMDLGATYGPLLQAVARLGCLLAGCCFGSPTTAWYSISFTDSYAYCPLNIALHPTQLYSAGLLFLLFLFMYCIVRPAHFKRGVASCLYIMGMSAERFFIDFFRGDRELFPEFFTWFSYNQLIALFLFVISSGILILLTTRTLTARR